MTFDDRILIREAERLSYVDPSTALRQMYEVQQRLARATHLTDNERNLRTTKLRRSREWWQLAVFTHAIGVAQGAKVLLSVEQSSDRDAVTKYRVGDTEHYVPLQLKELPSKERNPRGSLQSLQANINRKDYRRTTIAIYVERGGHGEASELPRLEVTSGPVHLFGFAAPDQSRIFLSHDLSSSEAEPRFWTVPHPAFDPSPRRPTEGVATCREWTGAD